MSRRLSFLELHGYKTFANLTPFDLSARITAIVGPNGSGKSNIADCIRWVLGEQSFSLLRGRKTEDMIFSGSEGRPRLGMASATITFNNEDGWMPIDFNEVAVTRRAYRDGDNEYLINGQRVRLKDVSELLYPSGLAERTYTVIGQGLVDAVLSLRADERRRLFEEAAGIGLYRARREEALRRLDATRRNLERVQDILLELTPRLSSLERQARRAREHVQAVTELRASLREWYGYHWQLAQSELATAQENARLQESRLLSVRQEQVQRDQQAAAHRQKIQEHRSVLNALHRELAQLHSQREALSRHLAVTEERGRLLESQLHGTEPDLLNLSLQLEGAETTLHDSAGEVDALQAELDEASSRLSVAQALLDEQKNQRSALEGEISQRQKLLADFLNNQGQLKALVVADQARLKRLEGSLEESRSSLAAVQANLQEEQARVEAAEKLASEAEVELRKSESSAAEARGKLELAEVKHQQIVDNVAQKTAQLAALRAQLDVLLQAETLLEGYSSGSRLLLQASRDGQLPGVHAALNEVLEVPPELEIPIAAALGEYLDSVLLEKGQDQALDILSSQHSRGIVLPLKNLKTPSRLAENATFSEGIVGLAAELVRFPESFRPAVELLLGRVLVVRDRQTAYKLLGQQLDGARLVTLDGEVFHASGAIQAAAGESRPGGTILGRSRQRKECQGRVAALEKQLITMDAKLEAVEGQLGDLKVRLDKQLQFKDAREADWKARQAETHRLQLAYERSMQQSELLAQQAVALQAEQQQVAGEIQDNERALAEVLPEVERMQLQLRQLSARLAEFSLDEEGSQVAYWSAQLAMTGARLSAARERIAERQQSLDRLAQARMSLESRRAQLTQELAQLGDERNQLQKQEEELGEQIRSQQERIEPAEADLLRLEGELNQALETDSQFRQRLSMAEQINAQTRIQFDRRQEALASLRRRIEDDFGLVAFDYAQEISGPKPLPFTGMVEQLPAVASLPPGLEETIHRQRLQIRRLGPINPEAQAEYDEVSARHAYLSSQVGDLNKAEEDIRQVIKELDELMERDFQKTYYLVAAEFKQIFTRLFGGGSAKLVLTDPDDISASGIDIEARLPGRRVQGLALLSGGERSLTATALIFSLIRISPPPFCVLDEVDAMLDEVNVGRFRELLNELSQKTQIIIITHNRNTVQVADVIYGVTMGRDSVSQVLSLKLDQLGDLVE